MRTIGILATVAGLILALLVKDDSGANAGENASELIWFGLGSLMVLVLAIIFWGRKYHRHEPVSAKLVREGPAAPGRRRS